MKKLLITGFEPFGGETTNPSWEAVKLLPDEIGGFVLKKIEVPTVFGKAAEKVLKTAEEYEPNAIICVGQAGGRAEITPEFVAINLRYAKIPDNEGNQPKDEHIIKNAPAAYFSTLPVRKMAEAIAESGLPAAVSYSAGSFVCNDLLYSVLNRYDGTETKSCFIHVPLLPEQTKDKPSMALEDIVKALKIAIENI